tara:strand:- start:29 stop:280 length:252 start_codon:yes stop_codon:yes gene_type:complete
MIIGRSLVVLTIFPFSENSSSVDSRPLLPKVPLIFCSRDIIFSIKINIPEEFPVVELHKVYNRLDIELAFCLLKLVRLNKQST